MMKDDQLDEHVCSRCSRERREHDEMVADRLGYWTSARNAMLQGEWPEDGKPTPSDVLNLAGFLANELSSNS